MHVYNSGGVVVTLRTFKEECVMGVPGRVLLRLEESIKVPERTLNKVIGRHLRKSADGARTMHSQHSFIH